MIYTKQSNMTDISSLASYWLLSLVNVLPRHEEILQCLPNAQILSVSVLLENSHELHSTAVQACSRAKTPEIRRTASISSNIWELILRCVILTNEGNDVSCSSGAS